MIFWKRNLEWALRRLRKFLNRENIYCYTIVCAEPLGDKMGFFFLVDIGIFSSNLRFITMDSKGSIIKVKHPATMETTNKKKKQAKRSHGAKRRRKEVGKRG